MPFPATLDGKQCLALATTIVLNPVWNTLKAQFEKLFDNKTQSQEPAVIL